VYFVGEVVGHDADGYLTLAVWLLVNRRCDGALLEVWGHLGEEIRGY